MTRSNTTRPIHDGHDLIDWTVPERQWPHLSVILLAAVMAAILIFLAVEFGQYVMSKAAHDAAWALESRQ